MITTLQMQTHLCLRDFRQRKNKKGEAYGWPIAIYSTPEHIWGREHVTSAYTESATESGERCMTKWQESDTKPEVDLYGYSIVRDLSAKSVRLIK